MNVVPLIIEPSPARMVDGATFEAFSRGVYSVVYLVPVCLN